MPNRLTVSHGNLYYGDNLIVCRYPEGDCDTIHWPMRRKDRENLISALFDMRECGEVESPVVLPDGEELSF